MQITHYEQTTKDLVLLEHVGKQKKTMLAKTDLSNAIIFKPWGFEYMIMNEGKSCGWMLHINKFHGTSFHCHMTKQTVVLVVSGMLLLTTSQKKQLMMPGDMAYIDKKTFHMMGTHTKDTRVIEIETPSYKPDAVRIIDFWGRKGEPYESQCKVVHLTKKSSIDEIEKRGKGKRHKPSLSSR
jgi:mannose-6-phosphate isomerase-like protein (cupin superfamily)